MLAAHYAVPFAGARARRAQHAGHAGRHGVHPRPCRRVGADLRPGVRRSRGGGREAGRTGAAARARGGGADDELEDADRGGKPLLHPVDDERSLLAINYTSGTTARPKGVMYHHRGAYLQALAMALHMGLDERLRLPVDAADVPLQRLVLSVGASPPSGGVHLCLPKVDARCDLAAHARVRRHAISAPRRRC